MNIEAMWNQTRTAVKASIFREELLKGIIRMGGRIAVIVTDDPRYRRRKLRTWTTLTAKDLHSTRHYNRHSKLAFIVEDLKELPAHLPFLATVLLNRNSKTGLVTAMRARAHPTGISTRLSNLEVFLNYLAVRKEHHFANCRAMSDPASSVMINVTHTPPPPGITVIGAPNPKKVTIQRLKERTGAAGGYYIPPFPSPFLDGDDVDADNRKN